MTSAAFEVEKKILSRGDFEVVEMVRNKNTMEII